MPTTPNKGYSYPVHGGAVNSWDTDLDAIFNYIDLNVAGPYPLTINSTTGAITYNSSGALVGSAAVNITPPSSLAQNLYYKLTGIMTNDIDLTLPAAGGLYIASNQTTGGFTFRVVTSGSTAVNVALAQGESKTVVCNGTDMAAANTASNTWTGATYAGSDQNAAIATDQNNYNPTDLNITTCLRLNVTAACSITGLAGGAASRDLELVNVGTATVKFPANSASSSAANRFANTFNLAPGQSIFLRYDATSLLWRPKNVATAYSSCAQASVSNDLTITNTVTPNTVLNITASESVLIDASGNAIKFENISTSVDSTTNGPGGCDLGTRAASSSYFTWFVSDGVNINSVVSTSAAAATVLANLTTSGFPNYIYMKRIGAQFTNASSNFFAIRQLGCHSQYINSGSGLPSIGTTTSTSYVAKSVVSIVPSTATVLYFLLANSGGGFGLVSPNNSYGTGVSLIVNPAYASTQAPAVSGSFILETTNVYIINTNGNTTALFAVGWDDNI